MNCITHNFELDKRTCKYIDNNDEACNDDTSSAWFIPDNRRCYFRYHYHINAKSSSNENSNSNNNHDDGGAAKGL
jgi:hypothetical protein